MTLRNDSDRPCSRCFGRGWVPLAAAHSWDKCGCGTPIRTYPSGAVSPRNDETHREPRGVHDA
jgi:hypothetical protein